MKGGGVGSQEGLRTRSIYTGAGPAWVMSLFSHRFSLGRTWPIFVTPQAVFLRVKWA